MGLKWVIMRGLYEVKVRYGWHRLMFKQRNWHDNEWLHWVTPKFSEDPGKLFDNWLNNKPRFFFDPKNKHNIRLKQTKILGKSGVEKLILEAESIKRGDFRYFFHQTGHLGFPPDWHLNPFTSQKSSAKEHWTKIPMQSGNSGDLKYIWEPGRFASAYTLSRAYILTDREDFAETFWLLIESWENDNPPNFGAHWKCGQETSLRIMAWCFALFAVVDSNSTTPERFAKLLGLIAAQADRVAADHIYSYLQQNNHSISEGVGLYIVGVLFPQLSNSKKWLEIGKNILEEDARRLIHDDGSFIQKSNNYHRLMLQDYLYAIRIAQVNGLSFSKEMLLRINKAADFMIGMLDERSGQSPNIGANDGALIVPLNNCDYSDFRPICSCINYLFYSDRILGNGLWDEDLLWFFGLETFDSNRNLVKRRNISACRDGYYTSGDEVSWALFKCGGFHDRPSHADMLHVDIWWRGINIACDAGTYQYFAEPERYLALHSTYCHNTIVVDENEQMERGPRFMWMKWLKASLRHKYGDSELGIESFEGEHDGYACLEDPVIHRRALVKCGLETWVVIDDLLGLDIHQIDLHWLMPELEYKFYPEQNNIVVSTSEGDYSLSIYTNSGESNLINLKVGVGDEAPKPRGKISHYYGDVEPGLSINAQIRSKLPLRLISFFSSVDVHKTLSFRESEIKFDDPEYGYTLILNQPGSDKILKLFDRKLLTKEINYSNN